MHVQLVKYDCIQVVASPLCIPSLSMSTPALTPCAKGASCVPTPALTPGHGYQGSTLDLESLFSIPMTMTPFGAASQSIDVSEDEDCKESLTLSLKKNKGTGFYKPCSSKYTPHTSFDYIDDNSAIKSGPSSRLSKSALKRKYLNVTVSEDEESNSSQPSSDADKSKSFLVPKKLFKLDLPDTTSTAASVYSDYTETLDGEFSNQCGLSAFYATFGADIQKQLHNKKKKLENMTKQTLKESQKHFNQSWVEQQQIQSNVVDEFQGKMMVEILEMERDIQKLVEAERKAEEFFTHQREMIHSNNESQRHRLENMKKLQYHFKERTKKVNKYNMNVNESVKEKLKEEMNLLQRKLIADIQKQEFENVKRSLQTLF